LPGNCPAESGHAINSAIKIGMKEMDDITHWQKIGKSMMSSSWEELIKSYEADHDLIFTQSTSSQTFRVQYK